jgi:hypothetical protein
MGAMPPGESPSGITEQSMAGAGISAVASAINRKVGAAAKQSQSLILLANPRRLMAFLA